jgi:Na+-transporting NADH:ubiquinone oxidoreductase subunit A
MQIHLDKGLDVPLAGIPLQCVDDAQPVSRVALLGSDYAGLRPRLLVDEGEHVRLGQTLFHDRANPDVPFTSPGTGVVETINRGPRRSLVSVVVQLDETSSVDGSSPPLAPIGNHAWGSSDGAQVRADLLASGLWTALRQRPYGRIPSPDTTPRSLFITAVDTNPLAPDPAVVVEQYRDEYLTGLKVLATLTEGPVYVCRAPGAAVPIPEGERFVCAEFDGPHPSGLAGTHIHFLDPVDTERYVWHTSYQDVIAVGHLYTHGRNWMERVISLAGSGVRNPRLLRASLGASIDDLTRGEILPGPCRVVSGSVLSGHRAVGASAFLGRHHCQVSILPEGGGREFLGWLAPGTDRFSATRAFVSALRAGALRIDTSQHGNRRAMVPIGSYERVMPLDLLVTPLLRALLVRDTETAERLGCLELEEEDLALCTLVCPSKYDYGLALRDTLKLIESNG